MRGRDGLFFVGAFAATLSRVASDAVPLGKVTAAGQPETRAPRGATVQVVQTWLAGHQLPIQDAANGYPFAPAVAGPWSRALPGDSADWVALVSGTNASTAINSTGEATRDRRLAIKESGGTSTNDGSGSSANNNALVEMPVDVGGIMSSLDVMAGFQTVQALADFASAVTGGIAAPILAVFSVALGFIISGIQQDLVVKYINSVADAYGRIATAAAKVESVVPSLVAASLHQQRFARLSSIAADLDAALLANKGSPAAITSSWVNTCRSRDYFTDFQYMHASASKIVDDFKGVAQYKVKKFVQLAVGYGVAYMKGYSAYTRCVVATSSDKATLQRILSEDASARATMRTNLLKMATGAQDVTNKFTSALLETVVKEARKSGEPVLDALSRTFDSVSFRYHERSEPCGKGDSREFNVNCGVWPVQVDYTCYAVAWSLDRKDIVVEKATGNGYSSYKGSARKCGFYVEDVNNCDLGRDCQQRTNELWAIYVQGDKYSPYKEKPMASMNKLPDINAIVGSGSSAATGLQDLMTAAQNDSLTLRDAMKSGGVQSIMAAIKSDDPALYASLSLPMDALLDNHEMYMAAIDNSVSDVNAYHGILMDSLHKLEDDIDTTGGEQLRAMQSLQSQTTAQHNQELAGIKTLDSSMTKLSSSLDQGFASTRSDIQAIQQQTSAKLQGLMGTVSSVGAKTRSEVKSVLDQASQLTAQRLSTLSSLIAETNSAQLGGIAQLSETIQETQRQTRDDIAREFDARQQQLRERVIATTYQIASSARLTVDSLLSVTDAMRTELGRQIQLVSTQLDVIDGRVTKISDGLDHLDKQLNDIIQLIYKLNVELAGIYRTIDDLPNALRRELRVERVEGYLRRAAHLSFAYTNYLKHNMAQLQGGEFVRACGVNAYYSLFQDLLTEVQPAALEPELRVFAFSRSDYERFGTTVLGAAYHQRFMLLPCANMKSMRDDGTVAMDDEAAQQFGDALLDAMWVFRANVEEKIPQFFLGAYNYNVAARVADYLVEARNKWADSNDFSLRAIEPVRARIQDDLGQYAYASFVNVRNASQLQVWGVDNATVGGGINRYGLVRSPAGDSLAFWSNTRKELPSSLRTRLEATELPAAMTAASLGAAFNGTPWQPYWDAGLVRAAARVAKVDDACPWAISSSHYPFCWERVGLCHCVQLEGLPDAPSAAQMTDRSLVPTDVALFTTFESPSDPRSEFLTTATRQSRADASDAGLGSAMRGVPTNRVRFSLCLTSGPVHAARLAATGDAHQPPPQFTRCLASDKRVYNVLPDTLVANASSSSSSTFVRTGSAVSEAMFRTLAIGDTVPEVTFFDAQDGAGNYIVCANCVMDELRTVFMFRVLSFKLGRPAREKSVVCERHPRLSNVEYCPATSSATGGRYWTPPVLLGSELPRLVAHIGAGLEAGLSDRVAMAEKLSAGLQSFLGATTDDFAYFKVYVAQAGAFDNTTDAYWTSLPSHADREERGWSVVPSFYATRAPAPTFPSDSDTPPATLAYDALVMWSTLPAEPRRVAYHVVNKKPKGVSLQSYLASAFAAYKSERILRGFFSEQMPADATECPVAGDADHFAYCTPTPVDAHCMCVQLEDLPDEYRELYDGQHAPHGHVVSFAVAADGGSGSDGGNTSASASAPLASYLVGRSTGSSASPNLAVLVDGRPWRNVSDVSLCLQTDFSHPERGATCVVAPGSTSSSTSSEPRGLRVQLAVDAAAAPSVVVGERVPEVYVSTPTWNARCRGCTDAVVSEMVQFQDDAPDVHVLFTGLVAGSECATVSADGGGELTVCIVD